jgi:hypothetical protein
MDGSSTTSAAWMRAYAEKECDYYEEQAIF